MNTPEVMLIFPPVVYSNFGRYYPSTAMLAAYLEANGIKTAQLDLNQMLLESLISPEYLSPVLALEQKTLSELSSRGDVSLNPDLRRLLAARVLSGKPDCFRDMQGRILPAGHPQVPLEILCAVSFPYYLDPPMSVLLSDEFWQLPQTLALQDYFDDIRLSDQIPESVHTVGISIPMGPQLGCALVLADALSREERFRIVLGGPTITLLGREDLSSLLLSHRSIDAAVQYQGEVPLLNLAKHFAQGGEEPWKVPGVLAVSGDTVMGGSGVSVLPKLSHLPFGLYDKEQLEHLASPEISVRQAEGCYWGQCAYCDYIELYPKSAGRYRPQYVGKLVDEMKFHIENNGVDKFCLITESLPPRVGKDMGRAILDLGLKVSWNSFAMVDPNFDVETLKIMAASGCSSLCIGVETVIDSVLSLVRKRATREMTCQFFENCREAGIKLEINLIPNLPTTTRDDAIEALKVIERYIDVFINISIFPFEATRSSDIGRNPEKFGLKVIEPRVNASGQAQFNANHLPIIDPAMTEEELYYTISRYKQLAARVSQKELDGVAPPSFDDTDEQTGMIFRFDDRYAEILIPEGRHKEIGPLFFNWMNGRMFHFPTLWSPIFKWLKEKESFERWELNGFLENLTGLEGIESEAIGNYIVKRLGEEGMVTAEAMLHAPSVTGMEAVQPLS